MAYDPVRRRYYVWWPDNVWHPVHGNGVILNIERDAIVVQFSYWTGTMDNKTWHERTCTVWKEHFTGAYKEIGGTGYWRLSSDSC